MEDASPCATIMDGRDRNDDVGVSSRRQAQLKSSRFSSSDLAGAPSGGDALAGHRWRARCASEGLRSRHAQGMDEGPDPVAPTRRRGRAPTAPCRADDGASDHQAGIDAARRRASKRGTKWTSVGADGDVSRKRAAVSRAARGQTTKGRKPDFACLDEVRLEALKIRRRRRGVADVGGRTREEVLLRRCSSR